MLQCSFYASETMYEQACARYVYFDPHRILLSSENFSIDKLERSRNKLAKWTDITIEMCRTGNKLVTMLIADEQFTHYNPVIVRLLERNGWYCLLEKNLRRYDFYRKYDSDLLRTVSSYYSKWSFKQLFYRKLPDAVLLELLKGELKVISAADLDMVAVLNARGNGMIENIEDLFELDNWKEILSVFLKPGIMKHTAERVIQAVVTRNKPDILRWFLSKNKELTRCALEDVSKASISAMAYRNQWDLALTICEILENHSMIFHVACIATDKERIDVLKRCLRSLTAREIRILIAYSYSTTIKRFLAKRL